MMAGGFYHCSVKSVGRTAGRSIVAAAAYRAAIRLEDERTGETADYRARGGVDETFVVARADASAQAQDIGRLWNDAERAEPRANGRLATEIVVALPHELDAAGRRQLAEDFARPIAERHGIAAQVSIHAPDKEGDQRNHHAHILFTHREYGPDGFGEVSNARAVMKKNKKGVFKETMIYGIAANPADIIALRKEWEQTVNRAYERAGLDIRVDHRSHEDRGIGQEPTKHLGPTANEMEKRGELSDRGNVNREITQRNAEARALAALEAEARNVSGQIIDLKAELAMQEARAAAVGRYDRLDETHQQVARDQFSARYDDLRAAEPPPEVVRVFDASANRTAEPAAPVYDRDSDNALWEKKLAEAAIAAQEARQHPGASAGMETRGGDPEPSHSAGRAASVDAERSTAELEPVVAAEQAAETHHAKRAASRISDSLGAFAETVLSGIFSFFGGGGEPKLTPMQMHDRARAETNEETLHARAYAAAEQQKEAEADERIFNQDRQQQQEDFAARYGVPGGSSGRSRERDDDYDRGRERER
jgi:hypothetical protein